MHSLRTRNVIWALSATAGALLSCSNGDKPLAWSCSNEAVPNGSVLECVASNANGLTDPYDCQPYGDYNPNCPPPNPDGGTSDYNPDAAPPTGGSDGGTSTTGQDSGGGTNDGNPDSGWTTPPGGNGDGGGSTPPGGYGDGGTGSKDGSCDGSHGPPNGPPGTDGGSQGPPNGPPGGPPGGDSGTNGPPFHCVPTGDSVLCVRPPRCNDGTHPAACGACIPDSVGSADCTPPSAGGCWVTGGGFIDETAGKDTFGGNGMPMKDGTVRGEWENIDHVGGGDMHGQVQYLFCRHVDEPGPGQPSGPSHNFTMNQVYFGGPASWSATGAAGGGYWFDVMAEDHGEPGNKPGPGNHGSGGPDYYHVTVRQMSGANQSGQVVFDAEGALVGGNIQIHPPNNGHPYSSSSLPSWVQLQP